MDMVKGKVALVTGAASGIGRATALSFAREGAKVVVSDIADGAEETVRMIQEQGGTASFVRCNVAEPNDVQHLIQSAVERYGQLDCAFNNAGIGGTQASTADYPIDEWNRLLSINLTGVFLCMREELRVMQARQQGVIVNNASILGLVGFRNSPAYVAAKHGVLGLTKTAALEAAPLRVRVTAVCPGFIHTPMVDSAFQDDPQAEQAIASMHAMNRMGRPEEISDAVVFLCSDAASFVTGQPLVIDGGYLSQ
ncbi:MAG: SDR family oxidoreductase [Nitrolancea sp.]